PRQTIPRKGAGRRGRRSARPVASGGHRDRQLARRRSGADRACRLKEETMTAETRDKLGRPVIAVTGIGLVTSLGVGKAVNWAKLIGGVSGIRQISRFPTAGLRT